MLPRRFAEQGFTLIELMVTLILLSVMLTLAAPSFLTFQRNAELTSSANSFMASLAAARAEAMKRQLRTFVVPADGSSWQSGWIVFVDVNSNVTSGAMTMEAGTDIEIARHDALPSTLAIVTPSGSTGFVDSGVKYAMFNGSGAMALVGAAGFANHALDISNGTDSRRIIANATGRMRVCKPEETGCTALADLPS